MKTDYVENVLDYWKLTNEIFMVKLKKDDGLDDDCDVKNTFPAHLDTSIGILFPWSIKNKFLHCRLMRN